MKQAFFFYANPYQPRCISAARALLEALEHKNCVIYSDRFLAANGVGQEAEKGELPENVRAMVAFGGDGTLLTAAPIAVARGLPMLGVNTGTVGFLMDGRAEDPEATAEALTAPQYRTEKCPLLEVRYDGKTYLALNDLSLTRGEHPGVIETTVLADGERVLGAHGDGVVVATPLGSTAYALSSGGPIVRPDTQCLTVTAIAARELLLRPVILPLNARITLLAHGRDRRRLQLAVDGQTLLPVTEEARIDLSVSDRQALLIRPEGQRFFATLRRKQRIWNQDEEQE